MTTFSGRYQCSAGRLAHPSLHQLQSQHSRASSIGWGSRLFSMGHHHRRRLIVGRGCFWHADDLRVELLPIIYELLSQSDPALLSLRRPDWPAQNWSTHAQTGPCLEQVVEHAPLKNRPSAPPSPIIANKLRLAKPS